MSCSWKEAETDELTNTIGASSFSIQPSMTSVSGLSGNEGSQLANATMIESNMYAYLFILEPASVTY